MESWQWLIHAGDQLTVPGILTFLLVGGVIALFRKWVVPGWMFTDCATDRDALEAKIAQIAVNNEEKLLRLEAEVERLRGERRR